MAEESKPTQDTPPPTDSPKEAAIQQETDFKSQFMTNWNKASEASKVEVEVKAPRDERVYSKDYDPSAVEVDDPKQMLEKKKPAAKPEQKKAAKVEKAVEVDSSEEDYPENAKSEESKNSWQKLKADREEKAKKLSALEAELLALKQQFDPDSFKKTKEENEKLTETIRRLNVELHPKFQETFDKPIVQAIDRAKKSVPQELHGEVDKWLRQPDSPQRDRAIQELTEQLPVHKQAAFIRYVEDATLAIENKQAAISQEKEYVSKWEQEQKSTQEKQRIQAEALAKSTFQNVLKEKFSNNPLFKIGDDETKNEVSRQRIARAESLLFGQNSPDQLAEAAFYAEYGREVTPLLQKAYEELQSAYAQIDKLTSKSMGKTSGSSSAAEGETDMWSAIRAKMAELG